MKSILTVINTQTDFVTASKFCTACALTNQIDNNSNNNSIILELLLCVKSILDQLNDDILTLLIYLLC